MARIAVRRRDGRATAGIRTELIAWHGRAAKITQDAEAYRLQTVADANGQTYPAQVRASGNFMLEDETHIPFPITAEIQQNGKVLKMDAPITTGDCNTCHTTLGDNDAPGRIVGP